MTVELENVQAYYGDSHVLHSVSLTVSPEEVACLLGRNGAGKTTTLLTVMGYRRPAPGRVRYKGRDISDLRPHQVARLGFGFVPQERGIFPSLTVLENLTTTARAPHGARWTVNEIFRLLPRLEERRANYGNQLSGGEQQMLAIARALLLNPEVLLLDEPSEGLAPMIVDEIVSIIRAVAADGMAVLLVEQSLSTALRVATRCHVMSKGRIVFSGSADELEARPDILEKHLAISH